MSIRKIFSTLLFLLSFLFAFSQDVSNRTPLALLLSNIENEFNYSFAYKDSALTNHYLDMKVSNIPFEQILTKLNNETAFNFKKIDNNVITVSLKEEFSLQCITVKEGLSQSPINNFILTTPYQVINVTNSQEVNAYIKSRTPVVVTATGYGTMNKTFLKKAKNCISISLYEKIEYLEPIILTNYLTKGIDKQNNASVTINYEDFDILPGLIETDVLQTLQALPGVQSVNETVSFLNIRGGTNDQNLILWDGIKMYQSGHFFGQISAFNPFLTQKVTLIKNGSSAKYGDGVSGIISMQSDQTKNDSSHGGFGINLISADAFADLPLSKKASVEVSARKSYNNFIETPTYNQYFDKIFQNTEVISQSESQSSSDEDFTFFDTNLKAIYEPSEKEYLRANFIVIGNSLNFLENAEIDNTNFSRQSELNQNNISGGLFYKREWNARVTSEVQFYGSLYSLDAINFDILNEQQLLQTNQVVESGFKTLTNISISKKINGFLGYQFNETGITNFEQINNPFFERRDKQVLRTNSIFSEATFENINTNITLGVRANHISKFNKILVEPRLRITHRLFKSLTVELLGELKSQTTSQVIDFQNDFLGVENRKWILSSPKDVPIIKGQQLSAGITYSKNRFLISIEPYIKHVEGITSQSQGFQNQFQETRTTGSYTVTGLDFLINKQFKNVNTWLSYSYAVNDYIFNELTPSEFHNNIDVRHTLTYGINYNWNNFKFSTGLNWHTGKPTTRLIANNEIENDQLNFATPNNGNIRDYFRVDTSILYDLKLFSKYNARVGVSVLNVFDRNNIINNFFRLNHTNTIEEVNESALRFTPNLTFRVLF